MRRVFWLTVGATAGILVVRKVNKVKQRFTATGLADTAGGLGDSIRAFADDVRAGMSVRETELREALGLDASGQERRGPAAAGDSRQPADPRDDGLERAHLLDHPTSHRKPTR